MSEVAETDLPSLAARFRRLIRAHGPMPVARFMGESNARYYAGRDPLGQRGDFVTAPDISQMFGELVGLWLADRWARAGRPADAVYAELGPGRATLAKDALRAMAKHGLRPAVHFVEGSPALRRVQERALPGATFHDSPASLPDDRPLLLAANEFFDALPVRQLVRTGRGWRERMVALGENEDFVFAAGTRPMDSAVSAADDGEPAGAVLETCPAAAALVEHLAARLASQGGAALIVDYGHLAPRAGSTLQAVRAHEKVDPLAMPGDADLTAHVDFAALAAAAEKAGARVQATTQGAWLTAMGIDLRAEALAARAPDRAAQIAAEHDRLVSSEQMGELFKVMALTGGGWPGGAGFPEG